jgi:hypothetical protein
MHVLAFSQSQQHISSVEHKPPFPGNEQSCVIICCCNQNTNMQLLSQSAYLNILDSLLTTFSSMIKVAAEYIPATKVTTTTGIKCHSSSIGAYYVENIRVAVCR